ncbi:DUF3419 family protein [Aestuariibaculum sediminum]|uniref:DUF3419 family protein n=1 Tax=Aestuariibaculum sediminum TaxID=2770637 RepID=A0A8J6PZ46_9FLAO|nr:DUF3419 family protein [Aestuariibaculum sediminum]MBD0831578.1 DUF3419 family protein [Aestuariibaculum sediminum]
MENNREQIQLSKLVFTHNWEDPISDEQALKIKSGDTVMAITSGGCNVLGFLLKDPKEVKSIDINLAQSYLLELKIAAIKTLNFEEFIAFSGLAKHQDRIALFEKLKYKLSSDALKFWESKYGVISRGFIMNGKYETFVKFSSKFLTLLQGHKRINGLFQDKSLDEQKRYFDEVWNTNRFKYLFKILFNKHILAKRGLVADYFHFDDGSSSFAESFYNRSKKAFRNLPVKGNYFVSLYLLGRYTNEREVPDYLKKENYNIIKQRVDRIELYTSDAQSWLNSLPDNSIDCFALSNICELMSVDETNRLFEAVKRTARQNARVIFRNLMIPREVPEHLNKFIIKDETLSKHIFNNDRSFVYGKVAAYVIP